MKKLLETERLFLCFYEKIDYEEKNIDGIYSLLADPMTMRFWPKPYTKEQVKEWITKSIDNCNNYGIGRLAIIEKVTGKQIGDCGIMRGVFAEEECWDLGIIIHYQYEARGYASEACKALIRYAFENLQLSALRANTPADHKAARWLALRSGMKLLKIFNNSKNRDIETALYEITREDFLVRK